MRRCRTCLPLAASSFFSSPAFFSPLLRKRLPSANKGALPPLFFPWRECWRGSLKKGSTGTRFSFFLSIMGSSSFPLDVEGMQDKLSSTFFFPSSFYTSRRRALRVRVVRAANPISRLSSLILLFPSIDGMAIGRHDALHPLLFSSHRSSKANRDGGDEPNLVPPFPVKLIFFFSAKKERS